MSIEQCGEYKVIRADSRLRNEPSGVCSIQPEVTEGGVVLHQNNTWPIMAGGCHVVVTAARTFKGIERPNPKPTLTGNK